MLHAPITNVDHFSVAPITGAHYFCVACQYPPRTILVHALIPVAQFFVSHANILCALHSMCCTMPKFSMPPPCTSTLRAPLIKLSRDNIYPHCACTNKIPLCSVNTAHTMCAIIMCVHTAKFSASIIAACATQSAPCNAKFSAHTLPRMPIFCAHPRTNIFRITTLHRAMPNLSVHTRAPIFSVHYHSAPRNAKFKCAHPRANIFLCITTLHRAMPNLSAHTCTPIFSVHYHSAPCNAKF
jgi:hypothetical protein